MKRKKAVPFKRCWEFFHCREEDQETCLMPQMREGRCWRVNVTCCQMDRDTPNPLSVKKNICITCAYYKEYGKIA